MAGFTAIATGIGLATTAGTTIGSFAQAGEQAKLKREAEEAAAKSMMDARKKLEVNYYEQLGIQKEPYELARRELLSQGALATQALMEGDERSLAAGVGRVQLAQQAGQEKVATAMQQELSQLEKLVAGEDTRLRDIGVQLDTMEAQGAQQAAADAQRAEAMAIQQGFAGLTSLGSQLASVAPLYEKTPEVRAMNRIKRQAARAGIDLSTLDLSDRDALSKIGINLTDRQFGSLQSQGIKTFNQLQEFNKKGSFGDSSIGGGEKQTKSDLGQRQQIDVGTVDYLFNQVPNVFSSFLTQPPQYTVRTEGLEQRVEDLEPLDPNIFNYQLPGVSNQYPGQTIGLSSSFYNPYYGVDPFNINK